jgi:hypothetical protein
VALPVAAQVVAFLVVVDALQLQVGQRLDPLGQRPRTLPQRRQQPAAVVGVAHPDVADAGQRPLPQLGWQERPLAGGAGPGGQGRFLERAIGTTKITPVEVVTDKAATYPIALDEVLPAAWLRTDRYANDHIEADHGRLKSRLGPMRGRKQDRSAKVCSPGMPSSRTCSVAITSWPSRNR